MAVVRHKEAIHSGHFMVSNFEAEAQDDEEDIAVPVSEDVLEAKCDDKEFKGRGFHKKSNTWLHNFLDTPAMQCNVWISKWFNRELEFANTLCLDLDIFKVPEEEEGVNLPAPNVRTPENVKSRFT